MTPPLLPHRSLKGGVKLREKVWPASRTSTSQRQHSLLHKGAVYIIILDNDVFFQYLDGIEFIGASALCQHYLQTEVRKGWAHLRNSLLQGPTLRHTEDRIRVFLSQGTGCSEVASIPSRKVLAHTVLLQLFIMGRGCVEVSNNLGSQFYHFTTRVLGIKLRYSSLVVSPFVSWWLPAEPSCQLSIEIFIAEISRYSSFT